MVVLHYVTLLRRPGDGRVVVGGAGFAAGLMGHSRTLFAENLTCTTWTLAHQGPPILSTRLLGRVVVLCGGR